MLTPRVLPVDFKREHATPALDVMAWLTRAFTYVADAERLGVADNWPTREEIAANLAANDGRLMGDCDDFAFAAAYALHDLGIAARVVTGVCETGAGHMVCEDVSGWVLDNRQNGRLTTWDELERIGYRSVRMNDLNFENLPEPAWHFVKVGRDGKRDYT